MASTGTPAYFVHPAEASHGDLGMIESGDVFIAISYSGASEELLDIVPLVKRRGAKLIAITGKADSALAREADVHLDAAVAQEACPLNLAPTASTTAALALGDALAVALLDARGFSKDDFARSHPRGRLPRQALLHVSDVMRKGEDLASVPETAPLREARARDDARPHRHDRGARRRRQAYRHLHRRRPAPRAGEGHRLCRRARRRRDDRGPAHDPARGARGRGGADDGERTRSTSCWWSTRAASWSARSTCTTCSAPRSSERGRATRSLQRARRVRLMIFDVDGVLTDGTLWYGPRGEALKAFNVLDGHGIKLLAASRRGDGAALRPPLEGGRARARASSASRDVLQGVRGQAPGVRKDAEEAPPAAPRPTGFMGDELVDLPVLERCGFACAPREAPRAVRSRVHYVAARARRPRRGARAVRPDCWRAARRLPAVRLPTTRLFPLGLMLALAALTFWLDRTVQRRGRRTRRCAGTIPDYLVINFTTTTYNREGAAETSAVGGEDGALPGRRHHRAVRAARGADQARRAAHDGARRPRRSCRATARRSSSTTTWCSSARPARGARPRRGSPPTSCTWCATARWCAPTAR